MGIVRTVGYLISQLTSAHAEAKELVVIVSAFPKHNLTGGKCVAKLQLPVGCGGTNANTWGGAREGEYLAVGSNISGLIQRTTETNSRPYILEPVGYTPGDKSLPGGAAIVM